jgi:hypothetical protein
MEINSNFNKNLNTTNAKKISFESIANLDRSMKFKFVEKKVVLAFFMLKSKDI